MRKMTAGLIIGATILMGACAADMEDLYIERRVRAGRTEDEAKCEIAHQYGWGGPTPERRAELRKSCDVIPAK